MHNRYVSFYGKEPGDPAKLAMARINKNLKSIGK
ncbi:hypothetical protein HK1_00769 [Tepidibacillus sp. HK-1]|nr:hypothetical protein HK1_00769 [Tepidibacillus sp. HK-1]